MCVWGGGGAVVNLECIVWLVDPYGMLCPQMLLEVRRQRLRVSHRAELARGAPSNRIGRTTQRGRHCASGRPQSPAQPLCPDAD